MLQLIGLLGWARAHEGAEELRATLKDFNQAAYQALPELSASDLTRLVEGKLVKVRLTSSSADEPQRVVGLQVVPVVREAVWVAQRLDNGNEDFRSFRVPVPAGNERWYQLLDAPRPFADRHWLIDVWDHAPTLAGTGGRCWEHPWKVSPEGWTAVEAAVSSGLVAGVDAPTFRAAVTVEVNNGAWIACSLSEGRTLMGFHAQSVVGGAIPDRLVADYALLSMGRLFERVAGRAATAASWYPGGLVAPDGRTLVLP